MYYHSFVSAVSLWFIDLVVAALLSPIDSLAADTSRGSPEAYRMRTPTSDEQKGLRRERRGHLS